MTSDVDKQPLAVKIRTLGRFIIEVDEKPLVFGTKVPRKPLELLKVLIALGGESVSVENMSEALWPESDGDHAYRAFVTTLKRLRTLIGRQSLYLIDSRLTLDPHLCWVDAQEFTKLLSLASQAINTGDGTAAWAHLKSALSLYQGPFLEGEFDPPEILSAREKLHSLFMRHIEEMGLFLIKNQQIEKAISLFQKGLEMDDLAEAFCQHLMRCFQQKGRLAEGITVYQRYCQILKAKMDLDPSPETEKVYQSLLDDQKQRSSPPEPSTDIPSGQPSAEPSPEMTKSVSAVKPSMISGDGWPPQRRQVTVGFFVLSGYSTISEKLDPEEVEEIMTRFKTGAERIVEYHGGIINQVVQRQLIAFFGIPSAHEDDPLRAVRSALELQKKVSQISSEVENQIGRPLRLKTSINTGLAVISSGGSQEGRYSVSGDVVTLCEYLAEQAKADEILLSEETNQLTATFFEANPLEPFQLKGTSKTLTAYRVTGESKTGGRPVETRFDASKQRGLTPFIGRERELVTLQNTLEKAIAGEGQFVTVVGEAGIGKSRLRYEFIEAWSGIPALRKNPDCDQAGGSPIMVLEGRCQSYGSETPYFPFINVFRRGLGLLEEDTSAQILEKTITQLKAIEPALEQYFPLYLHLLSIQSEDYPLPENLQGPALAAAFREALSAIFIMMAKSQPLVVVLEDWHWVDEASQAALKNLLTLIASHPIMLVVLYRPEFSSSWGNPSYHTPIILNSLESRHSEGILKATLKTDRLPEGLAALIHERTGGNPFFIEEVCTTLIEKGSLTVRKGSEGRLEVDLTDSLEQITLPETVQAVIRTRLDRLDSHLRDTLSLASVIGREFTHTILSQVSWGRGQASSGIPGLPSASRPSDQTDLSSTLEELKALDLIRQTHLLPEAKYMFKHFITREVTYESLLLKQRASLHRLVGETIEALYAGRLEEQFEVLAYHYSKSNEQEKALHYLELAGDKAVQNFSLADARNYYKVAIELIDGAWSGVVRDSGAAISISAFRTDEKAELQRRKRIEISLKWAETSYYAHPEMYASILEPSLEYAKELNSESQIAHLTLWLGYMNAMIGNSIQAINHYSQCIELTKQWKETDLQARSYVGIGRLYTIEAEYIKAKDFLEKGMSMLNNLGNQDEVAYAAGILSRVYGFTGNFEKAYDYATTGVRITESTGNLTRKAQSYFYLGKVNMIQGNWEKGIESCNQAIEIAQSIGNVLTSSLAMANVGFARFMLREREQGLATLQKSVEMIESSTFYILYPFFYGVLAFCYAEAGMSKDAMDMANKSREATPKGWKEFEWLTYLALAKVAAQETPLNVQQVDQYIEKGLGIAQDRGQRPAFAQGYFEYAKILSDDRRGTGDQQKAQDYLNQAIELFTEMKMPWWLEQAKTVQKKWKAR